LAAASGLLIPALVAATPTVPELVIPAPQVDAGIVTKRFLTHVFSLRNAGQAPLHVLRVRSCCGASCSLSATNLPPGTSAQARVLLDLAGRSGSFRKTIYLHTNDPANPITPLRILGIAAERFEANNAIHGEDSPPVRALHDIQPSHPMP
jgi:hypothetical protein